MSLRKSLARGDPMIWFTGSALGISLLMIFGLLAVILTNGLGVFWPHPVERVTLGDASVWAGEINQRQAIPNPGEADHLEKHRLQLRVGNRDVYG
ncbi:MAG: phosphate ABC transporter permease PstA, partial [Vicinamibacteria bacterium]